MHRKQNAHELVLNCFDVNIRKLHKQSHVPNINKKNWYTQR
jgi:hypothetical protein